MKKYIQIMVELSGNWIQLSTYLKSSLIKFGCSVIQIQPEHIFLSKARNSGLMQDGQVAGLNHQAFLQPYKRIPRPFWWP